MANKQPLHKILLSVIAALFGIQSSKKAQADFQETSPWVFVGFGVLLVILLVTSLMLVVRSVLS